MRQPTPDKLAIPCSTIGSARETQAKLLEALYDAESGTFACEQFEDRPNCALNLSVGIEHDLVFVEDEADRQCEPQIASRRLVELATVEARANDVQLRLGEGALHAEHEAIVEIGWVVHAVFVDHDRTSDGAQFEQPMPVLVRTRQPRRFQREDRTDVAHRHVADQCLEVGAGACCSSRLAQGRDREP